jgi:hypothetical protein
MEVLGVSGGFRKRKQPLHASWQGFHGLFGQKMCRDSTGERRWACLPNQPRLVATASAKQHAGASSLNDDSRCGEIEPPALLCLEKD